MLTNDAIKSSGLAISLLAILSLCILAFLGSNAAAQTGTEPEITWRPVLLQDEASGLYLTVDKQESSNSRHAPESGQILRLRPRELRPQLEATQVFFIRRWGGKETTNGHTIESRLPMTAANEIDKVLAADGNRAPKFIAWEHAAKGSRRFWDIKKDARGFYHFRNQNTGQYLAGMTREAINFDRDYASTSFEGNATAWRVLDGRTAREKAFDLQNQWLAEGQKLLETKRCVECALPDLILPPNSDLSGLDIRGATGEKFTASAVNLTGADFSDAAFSVFVVSSCNLTGANLKGIEAGHANFNGANLTNADLSNAKFNISSGLYGAKLIGTKFASASARDSTVYGATISGADLSKSDFTGSNFNAAKFSNVNLRGANLTNATFTYTDLSETNLTGAIGFLSGTDLDLVKLCNTILPDGTRSNRNCDGGFGPTSEPAPGR